MKKGNKCRKGFTIIEVIVVLAILAILFTITFPAFKTVHDREKLKAQKQVLQTMDESERLYPKPFGNGVYYFPFMGDEFRRALAVFIEKNPNLQVITMDSDVERVVYGQGIYGVTTGHTVVFRPYFVK